MTRRRIVLELGEATSGTTCGDCEYVRHTVEATICDVTWNTLVKGRDKRWRRSNECRAAEVKEVEDAE